MKALIALLVVALLVAGCVTPQQQEANAGQGQDAGAVSQAPDMPPPFPDEENGGTTDPDGPPPLPE